MNNPDDAQLHHEIHNLAQYIERFRTEIARISKGDPDSRFKTMSDQLDAIIAHTDSATHTILQNLESVMELMEKLREQAPSDDVSALCDQVFEKTTGAMEACTFQDITGQRVTKIVGSMRFVEERVNAMITLMGKDGIEATDTAMPEEEKEKSEDEKLLNGPQLPGEAISQDDIDKLFA